MTALVTFKGWKGKWWKNIKPGRAALDAALTVMPGAGMVSTLGKRAVAGIGPKLVRRASGKIARWFRGARGGHSGLRPGAGIGSRVTSGPLQLGKGQAFRAGGTAFNIRGAAKVGAAGVAAVGVGKAVGLGKTVKPSAAVTVAHTGVMPARLAHPSTRMSTSSSSSSSSPSRGPCKTCPPGSRMLCFKRKHNPEREAKRRAKRKAAREASKARTAKRRATAKAASSRRKATRSARGIRRALRGKR